ncbi:MAG: TlpA family protein disulfide reductase, partial [Sphingobacterium sp.]
RYLVGYHQVINETLEQGKKLFESYSINSNATAWQQVWYDWIGKIKFNQLNNLHFLHQQYSKNYNPSIEDFYKQYILEEDDSILIGDYRCNSYMFPHYLYYKSYSDLIFLLAQSGVDLNPTFGTLLDLLSVRFKSELFEQVAYSAILRQSANKDIDENTYLKLISRLENPEYKFSVEKMLIRKTKNCSGYPFILEDSDGRVFTPEDLRGKTVIMDFWYTGCHGCKGLYLHMKPIKSILSTDSNVVFLSINVDKTRKGWLETVSDPQNGYTDSTNINVWIGNDNKQNSMIRYYDIYSYPTLVILNGNNKILAYNPAYKTDIEKKALIALIKQSLVK